MQAEMSGASSRLSLEHNTFSKLDLWACRVVVISQNFISSKISNQGKAIFEISLNKMGMRFSLSLLVNAASFVSWLQLGLAKSSITFDLVWSNSATKIIRHKNCPIILIDSDVAGCIEGWLLVDKFNISWSNIKGPGLYSTSLFFLVYEVDDGIIIVES